MALPPPDIGEELARALASSRIGRLFDGFTRESIPFVVFKGLDHLAAAISGESDVDVLVSRDDWGRARRVLAASGFMEDRGAIATRPGAITVWRAFDPAAGAFVMAHVYCSLLLGEGMDVAYPYEDEVLEKSEEDSGLKRPWVTHELVIRLLDRAASADGAVDAHLAALAARVSEEDLVQADRARQLGAERGAVLERARRGLGLARVAASSLLVPTRRRDGWANRALRRVFRVQGASKIGRGRIVVLVAHTDAAARALEASLEPVATARRYRFARVRWWQVPSLLALAWVRKMLGQWAIIETVDGASLLRFGADTLSVGPTGAQPREFAALAMQAALEPHA